MITASDKHFWFCNSSTKLNAYNVKLTLKVFFVQILSAVQSSLKSNFGSGVLLQSYSGATCKSPWTNLSPNKTGHKNILLILCLP